MRQHLQHPRDTRLPKWVTCSVVGRAGHQDVYTTVPERLGLLCTKPIPFFTKYRAVGQSGTQAKNNTDIPIYFFPQVGRARGETWDTTIPGDTITMTAGISPTFGGHLMKLWVSGGTTFAVPTQILNHGDAAGRGLSGGIFFKSASGDLQNPTHNGGVAGQLVDFGDNSRGPISMAHGSPMVYYKVDRSDPDAVVTIDAWSLPAEWDTLGLQSGAFDFSDASGDMHSPVMVLYTDMLMKQKLFFNWMGREGLIKIEVRHDFIDLRTGKTYNLDLHDQFGSNEVPIAHFRFGFDEVYFYDVSGESSPSLMSGVESQDNPGVEYDQLGGNHNLTVRTDLTTITQDGTTYVDPTLVTGANGAMLWRSTDANPYSFGEGTDFTVAYYHSNFLKAGQGDLRYGTYAMLQAGRTETGSPSNSELAVDTAIIDHAYGWEGSTGDDHIPGGDPVVYTTFLSLGPFAKVVDDIDWLDANGY